MKRLMDAADTLLAVDSTAAPQAYHEAYDQLLWAVVTSARDELEDSSAGSTANRT